MMPRTRRPSGQFENLHGLSESSEHNVWTLMIQRCENPKQKSFSRYGGRGIKVCDRWRCPTGFANFYADMGPRPSPRHSIDRIDNNGNYEPGNVRWATSLEQARNQRTNVKLTYNGETLPMAAWAERAGMSRCAFWHRINTLRWPMKRALTTPVRTRRH